MGARGTLIGESTALPLAVHLANHLRGNDGLSLLASTGIGAPGILAVDRANRGLLPLLVPFAQLSPSIASERVPVCQAGVRWLPRGGEDCARGHLPNIRPPLASPQ